MGVKRRSLLHKLIVVIIIGCCSLATKTVAHRCAASIFTLDSKPVEYSHHRW